MGIVEKKKFGKLQWITVQTISVANQEASLLEEMCACPGTQFTAIDPKEGNIKGRQYMIMVSYHQD